MRQYHLITTPGGKTYRWGEDELRPDQAVEGLQDSDTVPGGCKEASGSLARKPGVDYSDMVRGSKWEIFGAGQHKVWEGRLQDAPRSSADHLVMTPSAVGYQAALSDDESAQCIPIDADMSAWGEPSAGRKVTYPAQQFNVNAQVQLLPAGSEGAPSAPAISHSWAQINNNANANPDNAESWYDSGGVELGRIMLDFIASKGLGGSWVEQIYASLNNTSASPGEVVKAFASVTTEGESFAIAASRFFLLLQTVFPEAFAGEGVWEDQWRNIKIFDRSEIPIYGTWPEIGVLASDVIAYALFRWVPQLNYTTSFNGSIRPSSFPIPHLAFKEPTTVMQIVEASLRFELLEWGVWPGQDGPTFYLNQRGEREGRKRWRMRVRPAQLKDTGQSIDQSWNRVVVSWPDVDGSTRTAGPLNSGYRVTSERLENTDPQNALNEAGLIRTKHIVLNDPASGPEGAFEAGERFLEQVDLLDGSGEATLTGYVEDENGVLWPYYCVHAGDLIEFLDSSIPGYRYIVEANRNRADRSVTIHIDAPPDSYQALLERLQAREVPVGLSS